MTAEWWNKAENPGEYGRPSMTTLGGLRLIPDTRMRQLHMAKELLCGNQPADLSLVIAVLRFPLYSIIFAVTTLNATWRQDKEENN